MKIKSKKVVVVSVFAVLIVLLVPLCYFRNFLYIAVIQICEPEIKLSKVFVETAEMTPEEMKKDERFHFDQSLMLINDDYQISEDNDWNIEEYKDSGVMMNTCMTEAFEKLSDAVKVRTGEKLYVSSHLRSKDEQMVVYENSPTLAAKPGSSEHETGLCLDVYILYNAGDNFIKTEGGKFVNTKCHEYGFIIRYPYYGKNSTGIRYEPWHIRYVGEVHASIIYTNGLTLEEYIFSLEEETVYSVENCYIVRCRLKNGTLTVPLNCREYTVSPDNTGCYIITAYK